MYDLLIGCHRSPLVDHPCNAAQFRGVVIDKRIPAASDDFVATEVQTPVARGCVAKWDDVRTAVASPRPRMIMPLSVEPSTRRLAYDPRKFIECAKKKPFPMDTVARMAYVASEGCYVTSLDDSLAFQHILLRPLTLFGFSYTGVDCCWRVLPFGFSASP